MSMNNFELPPKELFIGPIKWFGVNNPKIAHINPLNEQISLTKSWEELFWTGRTQSSLQLERLARCLSMVIPRDFSSSVNIARENDFDEIEVAFEKHVKPDQIFGDDQLKFGRIPEGPGNLSRWIMVGVAPRIAIGGIVSRPWLPPFMYEEGEPGSVDIRMLPLRVDVASELAHLATIV